jgi:large subunit ribosomal protein L24
MVHTAPLHKKHVLLAAHLADDLILKYRRRHIPVIRGDTVKVMRGEFRGQTGKVRRAVTKTGSIEVEGVVLTKVDGTKVPRSVHASNVLITKLNLADPWRRRRLAEGLPEDVKKEIEKEAEKQIEEQERRAAEEALRAEEAKEEMLPEVSEDAGYDGFEEGAALEGAPEEPLPEQTEESDGDEQHGVETGEETADETTDKKKEGEA